MLLFGNVGWNLFQQRCSGYAEYFERARGNFLEDNYSQSRRDYVVEINFDLQVLLFGNVGWNLFQQRCMGYVEYFERARGNLLEVTTVRVGETILSK